MYFLFSYWDFFYILLNNHEIILTRQEKMHELLANTREVQK